MDTFSSWVLHDTLPSFQSRLPSPILFPLDLQPCENRGWRPDASYDLEDDSWFNQYVHSAICQNDDQAIVLAPQLSVTIVGPELPSHERHSDLPADRQIRRTRFSRSQRQTLRQWVIEHSENPYLTAADRDSLVVQTGLSKEQVTGFIANYRRRQLARIEPVTNLESEETHEIELIDVSMHSEQQYPSNRATVDDMSSPCQSSSPPNSIGPLSQAEYAESDDGRTTEDYVPFCNFRGTLLEWYVQSYDLAQQGELHPVISAGDQSIAPEFVGMIAGANTSCNEPPLGSSNSKPARLKNDAFKTSTLRSQPTHQFDVTEAEGPSEALPTIYMSEYYASTMRSDLSPALQNFEQTHHDFSMGKHARIAEVVRPENNVSNPVYSTNRSPSSALLSKNNYSDPPTLLEIDHEGKRSNKEISIEHQPVAFSLRPPKFSSLPPKTYSRPLSFTAYETSPIRRKATPFDADSESGESASSTSSSSTVSSSGSRRGRRAYRVSKAAHGAFTAPHALTFECKDCGQYFKTRYTRDRHVTSVHKPKDIWLCWVDDFCPICYALPDECKHRCLECWIRPRNEREFYRKDAMRQHLMGFHRADIDEVTEEVFRKLLTRKDGVDVPNIAFFQNKIRKPVSLLQMISIALSASDRGLGISH